MKNNKKSLLIIILGVAFSYVLALLWWKMWMYHGFFSPPEFFSPFFKGDGEDAYGRVELEMFITILIPVLAGIFFYRFKEYLFS